MSGLGGKVAIIGTGIIKFGENCHQSLTDMIYEAVTLALADAKIERSRLEAAWLGCYEPIGSSGIRMIDNVHDQLRGRAGRMQVTGADMGLAHNLGGPGAVSAVAILSQP